MIQTGLGLRISFQKCLISYAAERLSASKKDSVLWNYSACTYMYFCRLFNNAFSIESVQHQMVG
jgi:hypothetical protein